MTEMLRFAVYNKPLECLNPLGIGAIRLEVGLGAEEAILFSHPLSERLW